MGFIPTKMVAGLLLLCCCTGSFVQMIMAQPSSPVNYQDLYETQWGGDHIQIVNNGSAINMILDQYSGCGFNSLQSYTYGYFSVSMQLIPNISAGTVTAFFVSSPVSSSGDFHDEIDFEFLGTISGQPYTLQTNLFANGTGGREERFTLWFDPTAAFHTYSVMWNHAMISWLVDGKIIRVFTNLEYLQIPYPSSQAAQAIGSLFDGSAWATVINGTAVPVDYAYAPFIAGFTNFVIDACVNDGVNVTTCTSDYQKNWWEGPAYTNLTATQVSSLKSIQNNYRYYNYCNDTVRYPDGHPECKYNYDI